MIQMNPQPKLTIGIMDRRAETHGSLNGPFLGNGFGPLSGRFSAREDSGSIAFFIEGRQEGFRLPWIRLDPVNDSTFRLLQVTIGNRFHWEKQKDLTYRGSMILKPRPDGTLAVLNEIPLEDYLVSVISSEMNPEAPVEFLRVHAILSRSWVLAALSRHQAAGTSSPPARPPGGSPGKPIVRWYDREDHDGYDVCADDHCQRYQGIPDIPRQAGEAVHDTRGRVITRDGKVCDGRYSKACGGLTEIYSTAWGDQSFPYLQSISDGRRFHPAIKTEEEANRWILSSPEAYCNTRDERLLDWILTPEDRRTTDFFRWSIEYLREELEAILREKSGYDFGRLREIRPVRRGPSGRISLLKIVGSKRSMTVGKELEIRRWLSGSHLYSSAFVLTEKNGRFLFRGAGWGHGVGLCQIGAAVMASQGFSAEAILRHYFKGITLTRIYE